MVAEEIKYVMYLKRPNTYISTIQLSKDFLTINLIAKVDIIRTKDRSKLSLGEERSILRIFKLKGKLRSLAPSIKINIRDITEVKIRELDKTYLRFYKDLISKFIKIKKEDKIYIISLKNRNNIIHSLIVKKPDLYVLKRFLKEYNIQT